MDTRDRIEMLKADAKFWWLDGVVAKTIVSLLSIYLLVVLVLGVYWSREPELFDVRQHAEKISAQDSRPVVTGVVTTATLIEVAKTLLEKPGGFIENDIMPPGIYLDNMPSWEFGVLVQVRDLAKTMRESLSRSQSQSIEDENLAIAEPRFNFDTNSWIFPRSEDMYRDGIDSLENYLIRLSDPSSPSQFYARADNLVAWLANVESRLGSLSQRLSASVGQKRLNTDLAGDSEAGQSTAMPKELTVKTPWHEVDDVLFEARGTTWALIHFLKAVEVDFAPVLEKKNALVSLQQIIRELEATQETIWSPLIIPNGRGFGLFANYSLVMASYISRANAGIIDLRELLTKG